MTIRSERPETRHERTFKVHMYHHTHWDREWWSTKERFRFRLVRTIDRILDTLEGDAGLNCFVLDGQTIVLKDYLQVRPAQRERVARHIREGRLFVGPWHILPDEFLVSGEATVRNLLLAERTARELDVPTSRVGYLPDSFGHLAQMPQILSGFGIDSAIVWRGFGAPPLGGEEGEGDVGRDSYLLPRARDARFPNRITSEFWWTALDGTRVLGVQLPLEYYRSHYKVSPGDETATHDQTIGRARRTLNYLKKYAATDVILEPMGGDHLPVDPRLPTLLKGINEAVGNEGFTYEVSSLDAFVEDVKAQSDRVTVEWHGEGRAFGRKAHLLPGVFSARLYLKRRNYEAQTALERFAEPLQAFASLHGESYERDYLWTAWERLIENHPHDSICGCSIDQVHREMITRFDEANQIADLLASDAHEALASRVDTSFAPGSLPISVFNPLNWTRADLATVLINGYLEVSPDTWALTDHEGNEVPFQTRTVHHETEKAEAFDWLGTAYTRSHDHNEFTEVRFVAKDVPGLGYRAYALRRRDKRRPDVRVRPYGVLGNVALDKGDTAPSDLLIAPGVLENAFVCVTVNFDDGTFDLHDKTTGETYERLGSFTDGGDNGDTYNYAWPLGDQIFSTSRVQPSVGWVEVGPASATLRVTWSLSLPGGLSNDRQSRSTEKVAFTLHHDVTLHAGVKRVDLKAHFDNTAKDHRLRAHFPLGAPVAVSSAETPYGVVDRPTALPNGQRGSAEPAVDEHPQTTFLSVTDGRRGLTIANRGLPEFSVSPDGTANLTVLRAVGYLSREDFLTRVGGAGPTIAVPDAQMLGPVFAEYSLVPHARSWADANAWREAHDFASPLHTATVISQVIPLRNAFHALDASLPPVGQFLNVEGRVLVTTVKEAELSDDLIVRFVNQTPESQRASVSLPHLAAARRVDLSETLVEDLAVEGGAVTLDARPWEIVTLALKVRP
ncbi:alpha-mannosidase [Deinococcus yavapaiensis]|uniref:Mannosylglycerate hydrolase n=1 Tax=Deinococcus yavapaiensis KR-236 TaxID=694435 RepID=A0A318S6T4_9DEIO|nr:glycoside hydrolase family 38 C-terminal domain-containing protein [Deinococcus yavapaiensis]PYE54603.1 mannosylglycerate hydrolase [Deinococcus yavapaiensis KR-236]